MTVRVLVCGGRDYTDRDAVFRALDLLHERRGISCVIHGKCHTPINADKLAGEWARSRGVSFEEYPVDRALDGPWPAAGSMRNARMLMLSRPERVVAFPTKGTGTHDMARRAKAAGLGEPWRPYGP